MKGILKLGIIGAIGYGLLRLVQRGSSWEGLSESELRGKIDERFAGRLTPEKLAMVQDKAVNMARARGKLIESPGEPA